MSVELVVGMVETVVRRGPDPGVAQVRSVVESLKRCSGAGLADPGVACPGVWVQCKCVRNVETASSPPNHCWRLHSAGLRPLLTGTFLQNRSAYLHVLHCLNPLMLPEQGALPSCPP